MNSCLVYARPSAGSSRRSTAASFSPLTAGLSPVTVTGRVAADGPGTFQPSRPSYGPGGTVCGHAEPSPSVVGGAASSWIASRRWEGGVLEVWRGMPRVGRLS